MKWNICASLTTFFPSGSIVTEEWPTFVLETTTEFEMRAKMRQIIESVDRDLAITRTGFSCQVRCKLNYDAADVSEDEPRPRGGYQLSEVEEAKELSRLKAGRWSVEFGEENLYFTNAKGQRYFAKVLDDPERLPQFLGALGYYENYGFIGYVAPSDRRCTQGYAVDDDGTGGAAAFTAWDAAEVEIYCEEHGLDSSRIYSGAVLEPCQSCNECGNSERVAAEAVAEALKL